MDRDRRKRRKQEGANLYIEHEPNCSSISREPVAEDRTLYENLRFPPNGRNLRYYGSPYGQDPMALHSECFALASRGTLATRSTMGEGGHLATPPLVLRAGAIASGAGERAQEQVRCGTSS